DGAYGSTVIDPSTGEWTYTLNNAAPEVQALAVGETLIDSVTVEVSDGNGGTDTLTFDVAINGTNDGPVAVDDTVGGGTGGGNRILFVSDSGTGGAIATVLSGAGYDVDVALDSYVGSWYNPGVTTALTG
ncbi:hypothetical protein CGU37_29435, partial [Pseudomonas fluorescens]